ncbi:MAG: DUF445 family protein, partial [Acidimicrobiales bacterium]
MSSTGTAGLSAAERLRHRRLRSTRRMAGSLLALVSAVFVVVTVLGGSGAWAGYVQAGAIAGMVGGLADWFAVTALFRRPLGLPIPHTAIVVRRKDHLAGTIGAFVQERLLAPSVIVARLAEADVVSKVGAWLADPSRSALLARHLCDGAIALSEVVGQEEVHDTLESLAREAAGAVPLAPLAGRVLGY